MTCCSLVMPCNNICRTNKEIKKNYIVKAVYCYKNMENSQWVLSCSFRYSRYNSLFDLKFNYFYPIKNA